MKPPTIKCPDCKEEIWDKITVDQRLNKCWNCKLRFDNESAIIQEVK